MSNISILGTSLSFGATVASVGNEVATLPATMLNDSQPTMVWQTDGLSNIYVVFDLGATYTIRQGGLYYTNYSGGGTFRMRLAATLANVTASPLYDSTAYNPWAAGSTALHPRPHLQHYITAGGVSGVRFVRYDVSDSGNADGYFRAGIHVEGDPFQPGIDKQLGSVKVGPVEAEQRKVGIGGQKKPRVLSRALGAGPIALVITDEEWRTGLAPLYYQYGVSEPVLYVANPEADEDERQQNTVYGLMTQVGRPEERGNGYNAVRVSFEEMP